MVGPLKNAIRRRHGRRRARHCRAPPAPAAPDRRAATRARRPLPPRARSAPQRDRQIISVALFEAERTGGCRAPVESTRRRPASAAAIAVIAERRPSGGLAWHGDAIGITVACKFARRPLCAEASFSARPSLSRRTGSRWSVCLGGEASGGAEPATSAASRVDPEGPPAIFRRFRDAGLPADRRTPCRGIGETRRTQIEFRKECIDLIPGQGHRHAQLRCSPGWSAS